MGLRSVKLCPFILGQCNCKVKIAKCKSQIRQEAILHFSICILIFALRYYTYYALISVCQQFKNHLQSSFKPSHASLPYIALLSVKAALAGWTQCSFYTVLCCWRLFSMNLFLFSDINITISIDTNKTIKLLTKIAASIFVNGLLNNRITKGSSRQEAHLS